MNTLNRSDNSASFSLTSVASRVILDVGNSNTVTIYAEREFGSAWSTYVISVNKITASSSVAANFDTAKTIPAGGGVVTLSVSDMLGLERIELAWSSGAVEAAGTTARIITTTELRAYESETASTILSGGRRAVGQGQSGSILPDSPP